jgi:hypothetical protein
LLYQLSYRVKNVQSSPQTSNSTTRTKKRPSPDGLFLGFESMRDQVFMMFLPTLRFLTGPFPPAALAARFFAAVIRPPLLAFAI